jgi:hypothetical protein
MHFVSEANFATEPCPIPRQLQIIQYADFSSSGAEDQAALEQIIDALRAAGGVELSKANESELSSEGFKRDRPSNENSRLMPAWLHSGSRRRWTLVFLSTALMLVAAAIGFNWIIVHQRTDDILVWKVGSPHTRDTPPVNIPPNLERLANDNGLKVQIRSFPAAGFAEGFFKAVSHHVQPDILAINNYGIIEGITTEVGVIKGIASDATVSGMLIRVSGSFSSLAGEEGGWQYLISSSRNYQKARALALKKANCDEGIAVTHIDERVLHEIKDTSLGVALSNAMGMDSSAAIHDAKICSSWGNKGQR